VKYNGVQVKVKVYSDPDYGDDRNSIAGFITFTNGQLISAKSWKQDIIATMMRKL